MNPILVTFLFLLLLKLPPGDLEKNIERIRRFLRACTPVNEGDLHVALVAFSRCRDERGFRPHGLTEQQNRIFDQLLIYFRPARGFDYRLGT